jgi:hypothetical protein
MDRQHPWDRSTKLSMIMKEQSGFIRSCWIGTSGLNHVHEAMDHHFNGRALMRVVSLGGGLLAAHLLLHDRSREITGKRVEMLAGVKEGCLFPQSYQSASY